MEFKYYMPVKTFFGRNCILKNRSEFLRLGKKALIVTGKSSSGRNGSLADVIKSLDSINIPHILYNSIEPNPTVESVRKAALFAKETGAEFIIGIGGGSPVDAAKVIAILAVNDIDDDTLFSGIFPERPLPIAAVPTTAGTGSEVTPYSILTYNKIQTKKSVGSDSIFPAVSFLDHGYTSTLTIETTINTAIDALSHSIEGYLSVRSTDIIKPYALESISLIGQCLQALKEKSVTDKEREELLYASMLAGIVIAHTGTTVIHSMGYPMTYHRNIDHGRANGLLLYNFLNFAGPVTHKVRDIINAMNMKSIDEFGEIIDNLLGEKELFSDEEISMFTDTAITSKNVSNTNPPPDKKDIRKIFEDSFKR